MKKNLGFTLIEILIALLIFAILGVLTAAGLHQTIKNNQMLNVQSRRLQQLQLAITLIRRDILQVINRPIVNANNLAEGAFTGSDMILTFTRTGLVNPFNVAHRSDMQRVGYRLSGDKLERVSWVSLDQAPGAKPQSQILLTGVASLKWSYVNADNKVVDSWPVSANSSQEPMPKAVLLTLKIKGEGEINGVFPIPAIGVAQSDTTTT